MNGHGCSSVRPVTARTPRQEGNPCGRPYDRQADHRVQHDAQQFGDGVHDRAGDEHAADDDRGEHGQGADWSDAPRRMPTPRYWGSRCAGKTGSSAPDGGARSTGTTAAAGWSSSSIS